MTLKFKKFTLVIFSVFSLFGFSQTSDLARIEYLYVPNSNAANDINRFRFFFQLPLKINEQNYFIVGGDYRYVSLELEEQPFDTSQLNSVQLIQGDLGFLHRTSGEWIYAIKAGLRISSNFETKLSSDDYIYVASAYAIRDRTNQDKYSKANRLIFGFEYTTTAGRNFPLPILNYYREFHPDWTYTLGVPKTNVRYKFNHKHHVQAFVTLDNFFANIQENQMIEGKLAENISATIVLGGLGYEFYLTDHLLYYGYLGHSFINDYRLRDNKREEVFVIEDRNTLYFRTGIKFKI